MGKFLPPLIFLSQWCLLIVFIIGGWGCHPVHDQFSDLSLSQPKGGSSDQDMNHEVGAEFKGYVEINQILNLRFFGGENKFELGEVINEKYNDSSSTIFGGSLLALLGGYQISGYGTQFRNGVPNGLNMLLWYLLLHHFSQKVSDVCNNATPALPLSDYLKSTLQPFCHWPWNKDNPEALTEYWLLVMSFDAPLEEMSGWQDFARRESLKSQSSSDVIFQLTMAILYNPYFLLKH